MEYTKIRDLEGQLQEAEERVQGTPAAITTTPPPDNLLNKLQAQTTIAEKTKKATTEVEIEMKCLRDQLWQSNAIWTMLRA